MKRAKIGSSTDFHAQGWPKSRNFEKSRKKSAFSKKPDFFPGFFQKPTFFKNYQITKFRANYSMEINELRIFRYINNKI